MRLMGIDMAHGGSRTPVTESEAEVILALMGEVLEEVYQRPASLAARRAARQAEPGRFGRGHGWGAWPRRPGSRQLL